MHLLPELGEKWEENAAGEPSEKKTMTRRLERSNCLIAFSCLRARNMPAEEFVLPTKMNLSTSSHGLACAVEPPLDLLIGTSICVADWET